MTLRTPGSTASRAEPGDAHRAGGKLATHVPLLRDRAVDDEPAGTHVVVGDHHRSQQREHEAEREVGDGVRVAPRRAEHNDAVLGRGGDVDVDGIAAAHADEPQRRSRYDLDTDVVCLDDQDLDVVEPRAQLGRRMQPHRNVAVPRVDLEIAERAQRIDSGSAERRQRQDPHRAQCNRRPSVSCRPCVCFDASSRSCSRSPSPSRAGRSIWRPARRTRKRAQAGPA
jgi:hypothetical protein